jgi:hypothetical protein
LLHHFDNCCMVLYIAPAGFFVGLHEAALGGALPACG